MKKVVKDCPNCKNTGMMAGYSASFGPQGGACEFPCPWCGRKPSKAWKAKRKADVDQAQSVQMADLAAILEARARSFVEKHNVWDASPEFPSYLKVSFGRHKVGDRLTVMIHIEKAKKP